MSLLTPQDRTLLIESLRPPTGYQLHTAIGTTYSLDPIALMVAPVGFTFFDIDPNDAESAGKDPLEILEAIRRHASKIVLFCEAGRIAVPRRHRPLLTYLEDRIIQAKSPIEGRSFHPKVWIIRYTNPEGGVFYRLLCLSRNLTFDRSWDTVLMLDGPLKEERENGFTENSGLREFVGSLPQMAITKVSPDIRKQVGLIEREISRVRWDLEGTPFNYIKFWPLGHNRRKTWPFRGRMQRLVVVSPFLSEGFLRKLSSEAESSVLISRPECLVRVSPDVLTTFSDCYQLTSQGTTPDAQNSEFLPGSEAPLEGLHAKLYIADDGWDGRLWTGSANATESAFNGNVEFMVELAGKKSDIGVSAFLDRVKGSASFSDLLEPYRPPETRECDLAMDRLERELDALRLPIAAAQWTIEVTRETEGQERYFLTAHTGTPLPNWGTHISVCCRPLSIERAFAQPLAPTTIANAKFRAIALESVTAFLVVQVHGSDGANIASIEFVVKTEIIGAPSNRRDRILQNMLHDQRALMRFLLILLADVSENHPGSTEVHSQAWKGNGKAGQSADALLEPLLQTLARNPARLEAIGSLLKELASSEEGAKLMPQGLHALFQAVWSAREDVGL